MDDKTLESELNYYEKLFQFQSPKNTKIEDIENFTKLKEIKLERTKNKEEFTNNEIIEYSDISENDNCDIYISNLKLIINYIYYYCYSYWFNY